jgi:FlaA1/EpsC-like NDP-sugar epimerase
VISSRRLFLKHLAKIFDVGALIGSFVAVTAIIYSSPADMTLGEFMAIRIKLGNCLLFALLLIAWHEIFMLCGLYVSKRLTRPGVEMVEVCKATSLASAFLFLCARVLHIQTVTFDFVLSFWVCCTVVMVLARLIGRSLLLQIRGKGRNSRFVLVVGTNKRAIEFADQVTRRPELGYRIVGFVDDDWAGLQHFEGAGYGRSCAFSGLADFLRHNVVDEAAIYLPLRSYYEHASQLISLCEHHGIAVRVDSQVFNMRNLPGPSANLSDDSHAASPRAMWPVVAKRAFDSLFSVLALIVFAPLLVATAALIKMG